MVSKNAIGTGMPIEVTYGGTGVASTTAYAVVCGGTTSTAALQAIASVGSAGEVLTSNGAGALPTFQATGGSGFTSVVIQTFTANGTYTPTAGMEYCIIECVGGGGGGAGTPAPGAGKEAVGGGGGGGEYARGVFDSTDIGASQAVTVGAGGAGGVNTTGSNGAASSVGSLISANGGTGGAASGGFTQVAANGGAGGTGGSGGDVIVGGQGGGFGCGSVDTQGGTAGMFACGGAGGSSAWGSGAIGQGLTSTGGLYNGAAAVGAGGGGGGALSCASSATTGGAGAAGIVVVTEFIA